MDQRKVRDGVNEIYSPEKQILPSLKVEAIAPIANPQVNDIDITDHELSFISKYFSSSSTSSLGVDSINSGGQKYAEQVNTPTIVEGSTTSSPIVTPKSSIYPSRIETSAGKGGESDIGDCNVDDMLLWATNLDVNDFG